MYPEIAGAVSGTRVAGPVTAHAHAWELRGEEHDERIVVREFACTGCDAVRLESG
jgi:hypothetical protein